MPQFLPPTARSETRVMMFVDGESLSKRYGASLGGHEPMSHVSYERDVYVWSPYASRSNGPQDVIRRYYYTSPPGDQLSRAAVEEKLKQVGIEAPRVFHRPRSGRSKRVDITLATDMLTHAHRHNYDIAILVAGDEDYVPLVEAVKAEGRRVAVWFVDDGLSPALKADSDHYGDIGKCLFSGPENEPAFTAIYG
ncbi:NYN domain-containing protein [Nitrospira sp. BLG_1]|uniref:NYN domain-containing protein n=1 Tax=Nitrospira sp. BLG_1 TaxID=3395883 RepID=UPI0039BCE67D